MAVGSSSMRQALFLRHHLEDDPGLVGQALERRGFTVAVELVTDGASPVDLGGVAVLGVLGSKWSVYDDESVGGWLEIELDAIRRADQASIPVLGICFGAQVLCTALGGTVEAAGTTELGWVDVPGAPADGMPEGPWFEFHSDRCVLPPAAKAITRNDVCVQAFRIGPHLGVQFHPELDAGQFERWLAAGAEEEARTLGASGAALLVEIKSREGEVTPRVDALVAGFLDHAVT